MSMNGELMTESNNANLCFDHKTPAGDVLEIVEPKPPNHHDPIVPGMTSRNGGRLAYTEKGDKVEWLQNEEDLDGESAWLLRRNDSVIVMMMLELYEKVWWNHHQNHAIAIANGEVQLTKEELPFFVEGARRAKEIEDKYGRENLGWSDFDLGLLNGRFSALRWVLGAEWNESLDV